MKEIGSEFWEYPSMTETENGLFPPETVWLGAGRQAIPLIVEDIRRHRRLDTVALPSWCCHTVIDPFLAMGVLPVFYDVTPAADGGLRRTYPDSGSVDATLVLDYFGYAEASPVPEGMGVVIRDLTHGIFTRIPNDADYYFGSLRKWGGFATGGFAWKRDGMLPVGKIEPDETYICARRRAFTEKAAYIAGKTDEKRFLEIFSAANEALSPIPACAGAPQDTDAARALDVGSMMNVRRRNAALLLEAVSDVAVFPRLGTDDCPLFVPILVPDGKRDDLRRRLIAANVYLPVHWPRTAAHRVSREGGVFYENELSLVCDQRYCADDMERIRGLLRRYL